MSAIALLSPPATQFDRMGLISGALSFPEQPHPDYIRQIAGELAGVRRIVSSDQEPCCRFAKELAQFLNVPHVDEPALWNQHLGLWQGSFASEFSRKFPRICQRLAEEPGSVTPPEGEGGDEIIARVVHFFENAARWGEDSGVVVPDPLRSWLRLYATRTLPAEWPLVSVEPSGNAPLEWVQLPAVEKWTAVSSSPSAAWRQWFQRPWKTRLQETP